MYKKYDISSLFFCDYALLCKKLYDKHEVKPKIIKTQNSTSDDKLINFLDVSSPNVIVENLFGVGLVSSEIEMFDKLLNNTGISLCILNVLIIQTTVSASYDFKNNIWGGNLSLRLKV